MRGFSGDCSGVICYTPGRDRPSPSTVTAAPWPPVASPSASRVTFAVLSAAADRMTGPALEVRGLAKTYRIGLLRKKSRPALKGLDLTVERGEILGLPRPQRLRQDHHLEDPHGPGVPRRRLGHHPGLAAAGRPLAAPRRVPARAALLLRLPDRPRVPGLRGPALRDGRLRAARARRASPGARRPAAVRGDPLAALLQGHDAAGGDRPGPDQRSRAGDPRRADVGPGSHRPPPGEGHHPGPQGSGEDRALLHPHPLRRGGPVRPGGPAARGRACCGWATWRASSARTSPTWRSWWPASGRTRWTAWLPVCVASHPLGERWRLEVGGGVAGRRGEGRGGGGRAHPLHPARAPVARGLLHQGDGRAKTEGEWELEG